MKSMISTKHWLVEFSNEWKQLFGKYNWYTFTLIYCYFEKGFVDGYEFHFTLLGLGIYIRYNTDKSNEQFDEWKREFNETLMEDMTKDNKTLSDYYRHDHKHCPDKNSPCGFEGPHRCCLCGEDK